MIEQNLEKPQVGSGQGVGKGRNRDGGREECKCPNCGEVIEHNRGIACTELKCPKCNTSMIGNE